MPTAVIRKARQPGPSQCTQHRGHQHGRRDLGRHPGQQQNRDVAAAPRRARPAAASTASPADAAEFLGARPGDPRQQRRVGARAPARRAAMSASAASSSQPIAGLTQARSGPPARSARPAAVAALGPPGRQQPVLQAEHRRVLVGLGVVVAEQVQDAVRAQQVDLVGRAVPRPARLRRPRPAGRAPRRRAGRVSPAGSDRRGRRRCRPAAAAAARPSGTRARRSGPSSPIQR